MDVCSFSECESSKSFFPQNILDFDKLEKSLAIWWYGPCFSVWWTSIISDLVPIKKYGGPHGYIHICGKPCHNKTSHLLLCRRLFRAFFNSFQKFAEQKLYLVFCSQISVWVKKWYLANSTTAENWLKSVASSELKIRFNECCPTTL